MESNAGMQLVPPIRRGYHAGLPRERACGLQAIFTPWTDSVGGRSLDRSHRMTTPSSDMQILPPADSFWTRHPIFIVVIGCLFLQTIAATCFVVSFETPNAATAIAHNLVSKGEYGADYWQRLRGHAGRIPPQPLRMFHLPGEPLYLAVGFHLPEPLHRYLHVPLTTLLIAAAAYVALRVAGPGAALATGAWAVIQPFIFLHGPVWDDAFFGSALEWAIVAILFFRLSRLRESASRVAWRTLALLAVLAGCAAIMRSQSQSFLVVLAALIFALRPLRTLWREAATVLIGVAIAVGSWGLRNQAALGQFAVGSSHDGITLWESNYPSAMEALLKQGQVERLNDQRMADDFAHTAEMGELQADAYFKDRAVRYIHSHPVEIIRNFGPKLAVAASGYKPEDSIRSLRNLIAFTSNGVLLLAALVGWFVRPRPADAGPRALWRCLLIVCPLMVLAIIAIGPIGLRYRMSVEPILWILGASLILRAMRPYVARANSR
jgi:hypothetical protein